LTTFCRTKENEEKLEFSTKGLLRYIALVVFEAYKTLATAVPILLTLPISVAPYEHPCNKINTLRTGHLNRLNARSWGF